MTMHASLMPPQHGVDSAPARRQLKRIDGRFRLGRRVKQLVSAYGARLGSLAADPLVAADIGKLAEHEALGESLRGRALSGLPVDYAILNQHERAVRRLRIALGIDKPPDPPPPPSLAELRRRAAAKREAGHE
jgi:hypothetical protein